MAARRSTQHSPALHLSGDAEADALVSSNPLALLIGMVLDQQFPIERAFAAPAELARRLERDLDAGHLAALDPDALAALFSRPPALHRYPGSMAGRVQALARSVAEEHGGDPTRLWADASDGAELLARVQALPGFGDQKARIFVALLGKQLGVRPPGWEAASAPYGEPGSYRSVADIVDQASLARVRAVKQEAKQAAKDASAATSGKAGKATGTGKTGGRASAPGRATSRR